MPKAATPSQTPSEPKEAQSVSTPQNDTKTPPQSSAPRQGFHPLQLIVAVLILLFLAGVGGYKYFEWKTLSDLSTLNNRTLTSELQLISEGHQLVEKVFPTEEDEETLEEQIEESKDKEEVVEILEDVVEDFEDKEKGSRTIVDLHKKYIETIKTHQTEYEQFRPRVKFLFGKRKQFANEMLDAQKKFYEHELKDAEGGLVYYYFGQNMLGLRKDQLVLMLFMVETDSMTNSREMNRAFSNLSPLEEYTRDNFTFEEQDLIKKTQPYGFESLEKMRRFLSSSYLIIKDFHAGDLRSASYKADKLHEDTLALDSIDMDRIEDENKDQRISLKRNQVEALNRRAELILDFESARTSKYPVLGDVNNWQKEMVACHLYLYKNDLYKTILDKLPKSSDWNGYLSDLSQVQPKTEAVDQRFDKEKIKLTNGDKKITFECKNDQDSKTYTFFYHHEEDKDEDKKEE